MNERLLPAGKSAFAALLLSALLFSASGCQAKSPAPPSILDQLKALVEKDGRESPPPDIFSMPAGVTSVQSHDEVVVTSVNYSSSMPPLTQPINDIPQGTIVHYYRVTSTRTKPDGSSRTERRLFYVYPDPSGEWHFFENKGAFARINDKE